METLWHMLSAQPTERPPGVSWVWLAALVVLTVLSYVVRKGKAKAEKGGNAEKEEDAPGQPKRHFRLDESIPAGRPGPPRRVRPPALQVRHVRPVPAGLPDPPPGVAGEGHGTVPVAPGTITEVRPGTLDAKPHIAPAAVSVEVIEPLPRPETPGRLAPALRPEAAGEPVRHRINLQGRHEAARAIIHAEILGPPLALRDGPECWER